MANLEIKNPPEFTEEIYQVTEEDFITAELENMGKEKLLNNTLYNKKGLEAHIEDTGKHIQQEEREKLGGIEEKANNYMHPSTHSAEMITETDKKQFVTVEQKAKLDAALGNARGFQYIKEQGWYQILALEHEVASTVDGGGGFCVIVQIATVANYDPNMSCIAACTFAYNQLHIQVISLCGNQHVIPKIRWARYANSAVLELYYAGQAEGNWVVATPLQWTTASTDAPKIRNLIKSPENPVRVVAELTLDGDKFDKLKREIEELKKSVSDGKNVVAAAITEKGQATAADASYATMAENIRKIQTGYDTTDATAIREYILVPHTAYGPNGKLSGTMPNHNNAAVLYCSVSKYNNDNYALQSSQKGYFSGTTKFVAQNEVIAAAIGLTADKIVKGNTILGISGKG